MTNIESYERDVVDCGVPLRDAHGLSVRYARALQSGACADWIELYVGTFATLLRRSHVTKVADAPAAQRLLQLVGDDLGVQLFDSEALAALSQVLHGRFRQAS